LTNNLQFFDSLIILTYVSEEQNSQIFKSVQLYTQNVLSQNDDTYKQRFIPQWSHFIYWILLFPFVLILYN